MQLGAAWHVALGLARAAAAAGTAHAGTVAPLLPEANHRRSAMQLLLLDHHHARPSTMLAAPLACLDGTADHLRAHKRVHTSQTLRPRCSTRGSSRRIRNLFRHL